jgi:hypothetical protein
MIVGEVALTLVLMGNYITLPVDLDRPLNETVTDKNLQYRADYNNRPSNTISSVMTDHQILQVLPAASTVSLCSFYC